MIFSIAVTLFITGATALPAAAVSQCHADNCLRAVRASARTGALDCSSYFRTTITPAIATVTVTNTVFATATLTEDVVQTDTVLTTTTETLHTTATEFIPFTETVQETRYSSAIFKRQETEMTSDIPSYATACSGAVRYSSACSCVGATETTITLPGETATVTVDATVTDSTVTVTATVATEFTTVVDTTSTVVVTDATITSSTAVATVTNVNYIALKDRFALQVQTSPWVGQYLYKGGNLVLAIDSSDQHGPSIFSIIDGVPYTEGLALNTLRSWMATYGSSPVLFTGSRFGSLEVLPSSVQDDVFSFLVADDSLAVAKIWVCNEPSWGITDAIAISQPSNQRLKFDNECVQITVKPVLVPF
ncbi:hypothetical protein DRE_07227 [Drechslerella stenobrocha 248]|uniref:Uncharacterized protein n=1 Tax=Drechslerella stenobrocha 248 TaxID=1043628 RepID=W7HVM3_9PEZI|nr:hypothetical protein DRE_07227 [Drechslerella stenobrocha 248]